MPSGLFGITHSNRSDKQHWTKNCFNSSFPTALACYMMAHGIPAIYARLAIENGDLKIVCDELPIQEAFRCGGRGCGELEFDFEAKFEPYQQFAFDGIDGIDLVVRDLSGKYFAPVEIKLTVLPTSATANKPEDEWGSEIVVRTATTSYCAFSIWDMVKDRHMLVREIFEETCDNAFDIVVWSDLAFSRLFIETPNDESMSRPMRASARMARALWELGKSGKIRVEEIYRQMAFGQQTDKEISVPGDRWRKYITTGRTVNPAVSKDALLEIIDPEYIEYLRPERRFDQTLYFTFASGNAR